MEEIFNNIKNYVLVNGSCSLPRSYIQTFRKIEVQVSIFFSLKVKNSIPRNWVRQRSKTIVVEGMIFAFVFRKNTIFHSFRSNVGYQISVGHSTDLPVSMPTSAERGGDASKHAQLCDLGPRPASGSFLLCSPLRFSYGCMRDPFSISYPIISDPNTQNENKCIRTCQNFTEWLNKNSSPNGLNENKRITRNRGMK